MKSKKFTQIVTSVFAFFLLMIQTPVACAEDVEPELMHLEQVWNDAHLTGNFEALDSLWDDQIVVVIPKMRLINKSDGLDMFRTGRMKFVRYETRDLSTHVYGDAAVVTGHLLRTRSMNGREPQDDWRFTKVYLRRNGQWRVILWQASDWPARRRWRLGQSLRGSSNQGASSKAGPFNRAVGTARWVTVSVLPALS
jgi:ketosteroid isomerase-like protein